MATDHAAIYAALFAKLQTAFPSVRHFSRRAIGPGDFPRVPLPALELSASDHRADRVKGLPPVWSDAAEIVIYARVDANDPDPEAEMFAFGKTLDDALEGETFGGKVQRAWVVGQDFYQGVAGGIGAAVFHVEMQVVGT